jgi:hypothetical protein
MLKKRRKEKHGSNICSGTGRKKTDDAKFFKKTFCG